VIFAVGVAFSALLFTAPASLRFAAKSAELEQLNQWQDIYSVQANALKISGCRDIPVQEAGPVRISWPTCIPDLDASGGKDVVLSENFVVPAELTRRVKFWKMVYSSWSSDHFALHSSAYPDVVLAVADITDPTKYKTDLARGRIGEATLAATKRQFRSALMTLHRMSKIPESSKSKPPMTPALARIAQLMEHIPQRDKYLQMASSLRIQRGQRDYIARGLATAMPYMPAIVAEFEKQEVPAELAYIAFVESSFNLGARSKVGASGVFQLMPDTARESMIVTDWIDERNDPIKAARGAARLFKQYYKLVKSWPLAVTSYNHGVGGVMDAKRRAKTDDISRLVGNYRGSAFGFASKNFYAEYLAMLATMRDVQKWLPDFSFPEELKFRNVTILTATRVSKVKRRHSLNNALVLALNPDIAPGLILRDGLLPKGYVLKVPVDMTDDPTVARLTNLIRDR
jgi:membrane-bound lytic murein transglycosylase D